MNVERIVPNMTRNVAYVIGVVAVLGMLSACAHAQVTADTPTKVSLYELLRGDNVLDGKLVDVVGFVCLRPEATAVFLSYRYCEKPEVATGIRIDTEWQKVRYRELYGHGAYGHVIGVYHFGKPGQAMIDSGLNPSSIGLANLVPTPQTYEWSFDVATIVGSDDPAFGAISSTTQNLIQYTKAKDYQNLAETFSPQGKRETENLFSDLKDSKVRLGWVFFGAPHSIYAALTSTDTSSLRYEAYALKEQGNYLSCVSIASEGISFQPSVDYLLKGGSKFCFTIYSTKAGYIIDSADFLFH